MSTSTINYNLTKPDLSEFYDVGVFNNNADKIDLQLKMNEENIKNVIIEATLTNNRSYPFNDSKQTIAFNAESMRRNINYTFYIEIEESEGGGIADTGGGVGDIIVSDKLINGFKVEYTGAAKSVTLKIYVQGGM